MSARGMHVTIDEVVYRESCLYCDNTRAAMRLEILTWPSRAPSFSTLHNPALGQVIRELFKILFFFTSGAPLILLTLLI